MDPDLDLALGLDLKNMLHMMTFSRVRDWVGGSKDPGWVVGLVVTW
jgi:hypothetical protein